MNARPAASHAGSRRITPMKHALSWMNRRNTPQTHVKRWREREAMQGRNCRQNAPQAH